MILSLPADAQRTRRDGEEDPVVSVYAVKSQQATERIAAVGSGQARQQVTLTTRVAGVITDVLFHGGDKVEAGQARKRASRSAG